MYSTYVDTSTTNGASEIDEREHWRLAPGAHLAVATSRRAMAMPIAVRTGTFEVDHSRGVGTLAIELAALDGSLRGDAMRAIGSDGSQRWRVSGMLRFCGSATPIDLTLHDHGVVHRSGTWWWASGTGATPRSGRRGGRQVSLVADLVFTR